MTRVQTVILAGPTGSGKSQLSLAVAEALGGTIINADSMQIYRELLVLTARPDADAEQRVPHRLFGVLGAHEPCTAARWRRMALTEIAVSHAAGRLPILVGGTGLYFKALIEGLAPVPPIPHEVRVRARDRRAAIGGEAFHAELAERDPVAAGRIAPGDTQRVLRAWEVVEATGRPLSDWQRQGGEHSTLDVFKVLLAPPRAALHAACDERFRRMIAKGALEEVRALKDLDLEPDVPIMKALGVRELLAHLGGTAALEEAIIAAQTATRRYVKRQSTWFRHQMSFDLVLDRPDAGMMVNVFHGWRGRLTGHG
ncbi:MAG: tRNA (adenosine(37)-N6)-dimethylallyltransferase MiaA [Alphaproteobacteria bacterium]